MVKKVISGGQAAVEISALCAAKSAGLETMNQPPTQYPIPPLPVLSGKAETAHEQTGPVTEGAGYSAAQTGNREQLGFKCAWAAFLLTVSLILLYAVGNWANWWNFFSIWIIVAVVITNFLLASIALWNTPKTGWREWIPLNCALTALGMAMLAALFYGGVGWSQRWNATLLTGMIGSTILIFVVALVALCLAPMFRSRRSLLAALIALTAGYLAFYMNYMCRLMLAFVGWSI